MIRAIAAVAVTAIAFALYARVEWPWFALGWVGLVPWLAALDRVISWRGTLVLALLMCEAFGLAVFWWFAVAIANYTDAPWGIGLLVLLFMAPLLQPQFITFAMVRRLARRAGANGWLTALIGAGVYVGTEWVFPKLFADTLGHGFLASPLMRQAADLAGAPGLTFGLVVANECVLLGIRRRASRRVIGPCLCLIMIVATLLAYGTVRRRQLEASERSGTPITVGMIQADISQYGRLAAELGTYEATRLIVDTHFALSAEALNRARLDLLVWPETVYPTTFGRPKSEDGAAFDRRIAAFVDATRVPLIFGAYDSDGGDEFNAAIFLEPSGDDRLEFDTYRKATLFPLTERVPALLESDVVRRWLPWLGSWHPGVGAAVLPVTLASGRSLHVAPLICYDAVEPRLALAAVQQGAELIVTLSNDSWFAVGGGPRLHLVVSAFRSLETRRPQVRVTNTGISALITVTGEVRDVIGVRQRGVSVVSVMPERSATTLMLKWGDWLGMAALIVAGLLLGVVMYKKR